MTERVIAENGFRPRRWIYQWDTLDRLVGLATPEGQRWRYVYDAFGRRVRKEMREGDSRSRVDYLWDGAAMAETWRGRDAGDGGPLTVERWHFEPSSFRPLAKEILRGQDRDGAFVAERTDFYPIVTDHLGTPKEMFDGEGVCVWRATHALWGRARLARAISTARSDEADTDCALRFANQWEDEESGLHYNLHRYYDPDTGQYLSVDPIGLDGGLRTHAYVDDPILRIDPYGLADTPGTITYPLHPSLTPQPGSYSSGISRAWSQEQDLVRTTGSGTVDWTPAQQEELLSTGRVKGYTGHHINNAATAPEWEGDPRNIRFLSNGRAGLPNDHLYADQGHRGNWQNSTKGRLIDRMKMIDRFKATCGG